MLRQPTMLASALVVAALSGASAQAQAVSLPEGTRAQITLTRRATDARRWRADAARWRGSIEAATADSFRLRLRDGRAYTFAWQELAVLERSLGRDRDHGAAHGALVGGAIGVVFLGGAAVLFTKGDDHLQTADLSELDGALVMMGVATGAAAGITIGTILGALNPAERSERVAASRVGLAVRPRAVGIAIALGTR